jgi:hypothetical protein
MLFNGTHSLPPALISSAVVSLIWILYGLPLLSIRAAVFTVYKISMKFTINGKFDVHQGFIGCTGT